MMRLGATAMVGVLVATLQSGATSAAPTPKCFGEPATIVGTAGKDFLEGTDGPDVIHALAGRDGVDGNGGDDLICLGRGRSGRYGGDTVSGGAGDDRIFGGPGPDIFFSSHASGDDLLRGGPGDDSIADWYGSDTLRGGRGDDSFTTAGPGTDKVAGGPGKDHIHSDRGRDDLRGGVGTDTVDYGSTSDRDGSGGSADVAMVVDLGRGQAFSRDRQPRGFHKSEDPGTDRLRGFENATTGGGADIIRGDGRDNVIVGDFGANRLYGRGGDDKIHLSRGRAWGGQDDDLISTRMKLLDGGPGFDLVTGWLGRYEVFRVRLDLRRGELTAAHSKGVVRDMEGGYGSTKSDVLLGDREDNVFFGGPSADRLGGRGGRDRLHGEGGEDVCRRGEVTYTCERTS